MGGGGKSQPFDVMPLGQLARASTATYIGADGLMKIAAPNELRHQHDPVTGEYLGVLIEPQATRLNPNATDFGAATKAAMSATKTGKTVGGLDEWKLVPDTTTGAHTLLMYAHPLNSVGSRNSFIVKAAEYSTICITRKISYSSSSDHFSRFDLAAGTFQDAAGGMLARMENLGGGLFRCSIDATNVAGVANNLAIAVESSPSASGFDKTAGNGTSGVYVYHAQCETGERETSPIFGDGVSVTRAADNLSIPLDDSWFNRQEGTLYFDLGANHLVRLGGDSPPFYMSMGLTGPSTLDQGAVGLTAARPISALLMGRFQLGSSFYPSISSPLVGKLAIGITASGVRASGNGSAITSQPGDGLSILAGVTQVYINPRYNGIIKDIRYGGRAMTDAELIALTT